MIDGKMHFPLHRTMKLGKLNGNCLLNTSRHLFQPATTTNKFTQRIRCLETCVIRAILWKSCISTYFTFLSSIQCKLMNPWSWAAVLIMDITYGINQKDSEQYINTAIEALDSIAVAGTPGTFLVDMLPSCESSSFYLQYSKKKLLIIFFKVRFIPEWFPGAGFKATARRWNELRVQMTEMPFLMVKKQIVSMLVIRDIL